MLRPVLQDIPDLLQQKLRSGGTGGTCFIMKTQTRQRFDRPEDREASDGELDKCIDEQAQVTGSRASVLRIGKVSVVLAVEREGEIRDVLKDRPEIQASRA